MVGYFLSLLVSEATALYKSTKCSELSEQNWKSAIRSNLYESIR